MNKYKIDIYEIDTIQKAQTSYEKIGEDENGKNKYDYVKTGQDIKEEVESLVYSQKKEDLDIAEVAIYINRVR